MKRSKGSFKRLIGLFLGVIEETAVNFEKVAVIPKVLEEIAWSLGGFTLTQVSFMRLQFQLGVFSEVFLVLR